VENTKMSTEEIKAAVSACNQFTQNLYRQTIKKAPKDKNALLSGISLARALAVVALGSPLGDTTKEIQACFGCQNESDLNNLIATAHQKCSVSGVFVNKTTIHQLLTDEVQHEIAFQNLDFKEDAAQIINEWVKQKTGNKTDQIVTAREIENIGMSLLICADHFSGIWQNKFYSGNTEKRLFYLDGSYNGSKASVNYLNTFKSKFRITNFCRLNATALEMPFEDETSMVFLLPNNGRGFKLMERKLKCIDLIKTLTFPKEKVMLDMVSVPKFKPCSTFMPKQLLKDLGIKTLFRPNKKSSEMSISDIKQKTSISWKQEEEEEETTPLANAITDNQAGRQLNVFLCERPFIYLIRSNTSGLILFIGRCVNPAEQV
jgi:serpin B